MGYFLLAVSVVIFAFQTICLKSFNIYCPKNKASFFLFSALYSGLIVLLLLLVNAGFGPVQASTGLLAFLFGLFFILTIYLYLKAMDSGPLAISALILSFGILLPISSGIIFWQETISLQQALALPLLFLTFFLSSKNPGQAKAKVNTGWLLTIIAAMLGNGLVLTIFKYHQRLLPGQEVYEFLMIAFATAALTAALICIKRVTKKEKISLANKKVFAFLILGMALTTAAGNVLAFSLARLVPAAIQFPVVNGGSVLVAALLSLLIFKEKLHWQTSGGLLLGLGALVLIGSG